MMAPSDLLPDIVLQAYRDGLFPMAENGEDDAFSFYKPYMRGLLPIETLHVPSRLRKTIRHRAFDVTLNRAFRDIIDGCAAVTQKRDKTWINKPIRNLFVELHQRGHAHSIEVWNPDGNLAGGLYGLSIGAVFCGESMVSWEKDASKIALVALCGLLSEAGYTLLDSQFINPHLRQFGAYEIPQEEYETLIGREMDKQTISLDSFRPMDVLQRYAGRTA
jgi:leucyl/phenylalanyl-tRNA--protein transferase